MFITSWTIDIRMNIQIWLLYRRYKSEWYNFWWATIQDIAACACKVWTLFGQACGQEECSQTTTMTMTTLPTTLPTTTTDKSWLHRLATDILSWTKIHRNKSYNVPISYLHVDGNIIFRAWMFSMRSLAPFIGYSLGVRATSVCADFSG